MCLDWHWHIYFPENDESGQSDDPRPIRPCRVIIVNFAESQDLVAGDLGGTVAFFADDWLTAIDPVRPIFAGRPSTFVLTFSRSPQQLLCCLRC